MASEQFIKYPEANPIHFVPENDPDILTKYNFRHYDEWWACERLAPHEGKLFYNQKIQHNDRIDLIFHSNNAGTVGATVEVYDNEWNYVTFIPTSSTSISGYEVTSEVSGFVDTGYTHIAQATMTSLGLDDGFYFLVIKVPFYEPADPEADTDGNVFVRMLSEPIMLMEQHRGTMLIEYTNSTNAFDLFCKTFNLVFGLRVEARIYNLTPTSNDTSYVDEMVDVTMLDSVPYNTFTFGIRHVPEYMLNKVNRALSCDKWRPDHSYKYWTKSKDAKLEVSASANNPFKWATIQIQRAQNNYSQQATRVMPVLVWKILNNGDSGTGTRFPYFVRKAAVNRTGASQVQLMANLNGPPGPFPYTTDCWRVRNTADETYLLDHANNVTRVTYGQLGYYGIVVNTAGDAAMYYYPHVTETNYTVPDSVVLSRMFQQNYNGSYGTGCFFDVKGKYIGYAILNSGGTQRVAGYGNGNPAITYLVGGGTINLLGNISQIFHFNQMAGVDTITEFKANHFETPNVISITGKLPATLEIFDIIAMSAFTLVQWSLFVPCASSLFAVSYYKSGVTSTVGMATFFANQQLTQFSGYDLTKCKLNAAAVDSAFNQMYNGGGGAEVFTQSGGEMYTNLQTPVAPPTGASATARNFIDVTKGWVVLTD